MRLEASMVVVISDYKNVRWAHAGNTRLVLMRNGRIKYRTKDTSLSQNMADKSEISLDQLETHEERHNLYCYLGQSGHFSPVISAKRKMDDGDILFLYTRGIWESVGDTELLDAADGVSEPEQVCTNMEDVVLSQQQGVLENYTIAAIFVNKVYRNPKASKNKKNYQNNNFHCYGSSNDRVYNMFLPDIVPIKKTSNKCLNMRNVVLLI